MLSHTYDYRSTLETSQRVNWKLEDVIDGRSLDFSKPFLPESLAGVNGIRCLNGREKLKLNQIRGFTYLYLFGLVEEYILPAVIEHAEGSAHGDDYEMRALLRFAEEEAKHIQLFKWFVRSSRRGSARPAAPSARRRRSRPPSSTTPGWACSWPPCTSNGSRRSTTWRA